MSSPMLDPTWTPAAGYAHAAALMSLCDRKPTIDHEGREHDVKEKKSTTSDKSTKVSARHYRIAQRIAKRDRRPIKTTIELAIERFDASSAEGSTS